MKDYCSASSSVIYMQLEAQKNQTWKGLEMHHSLPQRPLVSSAPGKSNSFHKQSQCVSSKNLEVFWVHHPNTHGSCYLESHCHYQVFISDNMELMNQQM